MEIPRFTLFLLASILVVGLPSAAGGAGKNFGWLTSNGSNGCRGTIGECLGGEFEMDSEINRRILVSYSSHISNQALNKGMALTKCPPGFSYYHNPCKPNANPNPNTRTCDKITRCRG
ncbi:hypothetical protein SAY86_025557 [Trapa natans]|uniref:Rapid ALkalinization Factor n=1 Tax=Trapa natans TaxID=22666 RepID=A0AAN7RE70_TRANT|nr:hypothetical protein SAY86_025557 [Trapa natans]